MDQGRSTPCPEYGPEHDLRGHRKSIGFAPRPATRHTPCHAPRGIPPQARLREDARAGAGRGQRRAPSRGGRFVIQRHRATRLHYDFRLEVDGRPRVVGRPQGPDPRPGRPPDGRPRRGPPDRVLRLRGRHPVQAVRRRRRDRLGLGHLGGRGADPRRRDRHPGRRAQVRASTARSSTGRFTIVRTSGRRRKGDDPAARAFEDDEGDQWLLIHKRGPDRGHGLGRRGPPAERQDRPDQRRRQGRPRRALDRPGAGRGRRDRPDRRRRRADARRRSSRCSRRSPPSRSATPTGCSRSSGTAFGSRRSSTTARSSIWTRNLKDAETYFPELLSPPTWIDARRRSSMARSWPSTTTGRPDFSLLQERLGARRARRASSTRRSTCSTSTGGRCSTSPLEDRKRLLKSVLAPHPRVRFAAHVEGEGEAFHEAAPGAGPRGHRRQAPPLALRAGPRGPRPG